jgi:hypothetical protein
MTEPLAGLDGDEPQSVSSQSEELKRERRDLFATIKFSKFLAAIGIIGWTVGFTQCILTIMLPGNNWGLMISGASFAAFGSLFFFLSVKTKQGMKTLYPTAWKEYEWQQRVLKEMAESRQSVDAGR